MNFHRHVPYLNFISASFPPLLSSCHSSWYYCAYPSASLSVQVSPPVCNRMVLIQFLWTDIRRLLTVGFHEVSILCSSRRILFFIYIHLDEPCVRRRPHMRTHPFHRTRSYVSPTLSSHSPRDDHVLIHANALTRTQRTKEARRPCRAVYPGSRSQRDTSVRA